MSSDITPALPELRLPKRHSADARVTSDFDAEFVKIFEERYPRLYRYLDRLTGEPDLASDVAQDAFVRLYQRGAVPAVPAAWLITVAMNLLRNAQTSRARRRRLLTPWRAERSHSDASPAADADVLASDIRRHVRAAIDMLPQRERGLLLLRAEGYSYREIALALGLEESSVGTLLARAQLAFREFYGDTPHGR